MKQASKEQGTTSAEELRNDCARQKQRNYWAAEFPMCTLTQQAEDHYSQLKRCRLAKQWSGGYFLTCFNLEPPIEVHSKDCRLHSLAMNSQLRLLNSDQSREEEINERELVAQLKSTLANSSDDGILDPRLIFMSVDVQQQA